MDLDHFKSINDVHGHIIGSRLLAEIGNLIKRTLGPDHAAFRYGGDEFVALLRGMDKPAATAAAQNILSCLTEARFLTADGLSLSMTASLGLATFPQDGATLQEMIRVADTMMYLAKAQGRNRLVVADTNAPVTQPVPKTSRHS
jgi:diguanylate cyclase (GGDEF)-like protein